MGVVEGVHRLQHVRGALSTEPQSTSPLPLGIGRQVDVAERVHRLQHPTLNGQWVYHDGVTMHPYWAYRRSTPAR